MKADTYKNLMIKNRFVQLLLIMTALSASNSAKAADPLSAIAALNNALHATSLAAMLTTVKGNGTNLNKVKTVPRLKVESGCGDCQLTNATKLLLMASYNELAKANDITINPDAVIVFKVTNLFARNSFLRGTFGTLSGADVIRGHFENEATDISEYSLSHEMGFDEITQSLGEDLLKATVANNIKQLSAVP
jgi:hypothetical protein